MIIVFFYNFMMVYSNHYNILCAKVHYLFRNARTFHELFKFRMFNPVVGTHPRCILIRGREYIYIYIQVSDLLPSLYSSSSHPVVGTHPRCVLIAGDGPIKWEFSSLYIPDPRIRTHLGCVPTTGWGSWIG
jgi:hypothetical protein